MRYCLLILFAGLLFINSNASHSGGGEIEYTWLDTNIYRFTYKLYKVPNGVGGSNPFSLELKSSNCGISKTIKLPLVNSYFLYKACPYTNGYNTIYLMEFSKIDTLPSNCSDWVIFTQDCCRPSYTNITGSSNTIFRVEARLNNLNVVNNSSPTFVSPPISLCRLNQEQNFSFLATDSDGDSIVYSLTPPLSQSNYNQPSYPMSYNTGYTYLYPLSSSIPFSLNKLGMLKFKPNMVQTSIVVVKAEEYRNGILIGSVMREARIVSTNDNNYVPYLSGINGTLGKDTLINCYTSQTDTLSFYTILTDSSITDSVKVRLYNPDSLNILNPDSFYAFHGDTITFFYQAKSGKKKYEINIFLSDNFSGCPGQNFHTFGLYIDSCKISSIGNSGINKYEIKAYPNPFNEFVDFHTETQSSYTICIYDCLGKAIVREKVFGESIFRIETSQFEKGIYFAEVTFSNLNSKKTIKLIKY